jgi:SAM-dependent methyltransferase
MSDPLSQRLADYGEVLDRLDDLVALESLRQLGVFRALVAGPRDLEGLAQQTGTAAPRLRAALDLVRNMGFLQLEGGLYRLVPGDEVLFDPAGPVGGNPGLPDLALFLERRAAAWKTLKTNVPLASPATGGDVSAELRASFLQHVHDVSGDVADEVASRLTKFAPQHLADLGCGPGTYALALLRANPEARATLVDRANAKAFVEGLCAEASVSERADFHARDILVDDLGQDLDLVLLSENIHNFGPDQNLQLLRNIARCLRPGGRVAIKDTRVEPNRSGPRSALRFSFVLSLFADQGTVYTEAEVVALLEQAGLRYEETLCLESRPESYLIIGRK